MTVATDQPAEVSPDQQADEAPGDVSEVTWRELTWEELLAEADRVGPDARFVTWSDDEVVDRLSVGAAELEAAFCRWLELLAELVVRRVWADQGSRTPAAWLSWKLGVAPSTAREQVRVALQLRDYPQVRARFADGTLSYSKVRAITRCGRPNCEELLLAWADDATAQQLERIARSFRTAERSLHDAAVAADVDDAAHCSVRSRAVGVDRRELRVVGPAERIVAIEDALRRLGGDLAAERRGGGPDATPDATPDVASLDEATLDDAKSEEATPVDATPGDVALADGDALVVPFPRVTGEDQVDALEVALAAAEVGRARDTTGSDRDTLVLHAPLDAIVTAASDDRADEVVAARDDHGRVRGMDRSALRRFGCDAGVVLVAVDGDGSPVDAGRRTRVTSAPLRRALRRRDGGCTFPGCGATRHLHAHHVVHWADGGPTDLANLVLVCGFHHRFVHRRGWHIEVRADGRHRYRSSAAGSPVERVGRPPGATGAEVAATAPGSASAEALRPPTHLGGPYDLDIAVAVLQRRHAAARAVRGPGAVAA
jgi:hypothetical protein